MVLCKGEQCSVKNTCLRFTSLNANDTPQTIIRRCYSQKRYVQDIGNVNEDGKRDYFIF